MTRAGYLWHLVRRSFHGTIRRLEVGEATTAILVLVPAYLFPAYRERLEILFLVLLGLFVLTFVVGLFLAAHASHKETEAALDRHRQEISDLRAQIYAGDHEPTLVYARHRFANLKEPVRVVLEQLATRGDMSWEEILSATEELRQKPLIQQDIEDSGFVSRDAGNGRWHLSDELGQLVPRLVKEWRAQHPASQPGTR
jgi:hypothetical protein